MQSQTLRALLLMIVVGTFVPPLALAEGGPTSLEPGAPSPSPSASPSSTPTPSPQPLPSGAPPSTTGSADGSGGLDGGGLDGGGVTTGGTTGAVDGGGTGSTGAASTGAATAGPVPSPAGGSPSPGGGVTAPADGSPSPGGGVTAPADGSPSPTGGVTAPAGGSAGGAGGTSPGGTGKPCAACMYANAQKAPPNPCVGGPGNCVAAPAGGGPVPPAPAGKGANFSDSGPLAGKPPQAVADCIAGAAGDALLGKLCGAVPDCANLKNAIEAVQNSAQCCPQCNGGSGAPDPTACAKALCSTAGAVVGPLGAACDIGGLVGDIASCVAAPLVTFLCTLPQQQNPPPVVNPNYCATLRGQPGGKAACRDCCAINDPNGGRCLDACF